MPVEQLQTEFEALPQGDFVRLRKWFIERDWEEWDQQLESDVAAGKLDFLIEEAMTARSKSTLSEF